LFLFTFSLEIILFFSILGIVEKKKRGFLK
jgi:hypothetical protein